MMDVVHQVDGMAAALTKRWWVLLGQGIVMLVLAALALLQPTTLFQFIGAFALVDGVSKLLVSLHPQPNDRRRWPALVIAGLDIVFGLAIWAAPRGAAAILTYLIAAWAVAVGLLLILWGTRLRAEISDSWLVSMLGVLAILFGVVVFANVRVGLVSLLATFAVYMTAGGVFAILLAFRLRRLGADRNEDRR